MNTECHPGGYYLECYPGARSVGQDTHYSDVIMTTMASEITSLTVVYSSFIQMQIKENIKVPRKCNAVTRKMFTLDDVIMIIKM